MTTIAEAEERVLTALVQLWEVGAWVPREIIEEALALELDVPTYMVPPPRRVCQGRCKSGKTCTNTARSDSNFCGIHAEEPTPRGGTLCSVEGCKSFVGKWRPLCFSHAKKEGLVPEPKKVGECSICYNEITEASVRVIGCKHLFHTKCINTWFSQQAAKGNQKTCPLCRFVV